VIFFIKICLEDCVTNKQARRPTVPDQRFKRARPSMFSNSVPLLHELRENVSWRKYSVFLKDVR
jgi:hypothetical protein